MFTRMTYTLTKSKWARDQGEKAAEYLGGFCATLKLSSRPARSLSSSASRLWRSGQPRLGEKATHEVRGAGVFLPLVICLSVKRQFVGSPLEVFCPLEVFLPAYRKGLAGGATSQSPSQSWCQPGHPELNLHPLLWTLLTQPPNRGNTEKNPTAIKRLRRLR